MLGLLHFDHAHQGISGVVSISYLCYESVLEPHETFEGTLMSLYELFSQRSLVETVRDHVESSLAFIGFEVEHNSNFTDAGEGPDSAGI